MRIFENKLDIITMSESTSSLLKKYSSRFKRLNETHFRLQSMTTTIVSYKTPRHLAKCGGVGQNRS